MILVDDTIAASELAGILVLVCLLWAAWAIGWFARIESHALGAPIVNRLGLVWLREGFGTRVRASGAGADGHPLELRFGRGAEPGTLRIWRREGKGWTAIEADAL